MVEPRREASRTGGAPRLRLVIGAMVIEQAMRGVQQPRANDRTSGGYAGGRRRFPA
jgi:hypothetical protein